MARITYNTVVTNIEGSIGNITFQKNGSGNIARFRSRASGRVTIKSLNATYKARLLPNYYRGLTAEQQAQWVSYANSYRKYNTPVKSTKLSALNWYVSLNWVSLNTGGGLFETPPLRVFPVAVPQFGLSVSSTSLILNFTNPIATEDNYLIISTSMPVSGQSANKLTSIVQLAITAYNGTESYDITQGWALTHGVSWAECYTGNARNIIVKVQMCNSASGLRSPAIYLNSKNDTASMGVGSQIIGTSNQIA